MQPNNIARAIGCLHICTQTSVFELIKQMKWSDCEVRSSTNLSTSQTNVQTDLNKKKQISVTTTKTIFFFNYLCFFELDGLVLIITADGKTIMSYESSAG